MQLLEFDRPKINSKEQAVISLELRLIENRIEPAIYPTYFDKIYSPWRSSRDRLTGLPIEDDQLRNHIVGELKSCVQNGGNFACLYSDSDNLKRANDISRRLGDEVIKVNAATVCNSLDAIDLEGVSIITTRPTHAADETVTWLLNLSDEQVVNVRQRVEMMNKVKKVFPYSETEDYTFSNSVALIDSQNPQFTPIIEETEKFLQESEKNMPYDLHNHIIQYAEDRTKLTKIAKDITRVPIEHLGETTSSEEVIKVLSDELGNTRISTPLLRTLLTIIRDTTIMERLSTSQTIEMICANIDVNPKNLQEFTLQEIHEIYYDFILHDIYAKAGYDDV